MTGEIRLLMQGRKGPGSMLMTANLVRSSMNYFHCGKQGHTANVCLGNPLKRCGKFGHRAQRCRMDQNALQATPVSSSTQQGNVSTLTQEEEKDAHGVIYAQRLAKADYSRGKKPKGRGN